MESEQVEIIVAGHICLDIIPKLGESKRRYETLLIPGQLVNVGPALMATGGAVSNTGIALHRLGISTRLMGKVGDDNFGKVIIQLIQSNGASLAEKMIISKGEDSSYTIVINPPNVDRMFLHCPGANDTFEEKDVDLKQVQAARLFHFGYPPLMKQMYMDEGKQLAGLMKNMDAIGLVTSLDMAKPDPESEAGQADWFSILERTLPYVDLFMPSVDEIAYMLEGRLSDAAGEERSSHERQQLDGSLLSQMAQKLIQMGASVVMLKLGENGLYVRTAATLPFLEKLGVTGQEEGRNWRNRELITPCFNVQVKGTTGAGDCTIAGFLAGIITGMNVEQAMIHAVAVGACNVEQADATSGIPSWNDVQARITKGWKRREVLIPLPNWEWNESAQLWSGPNDHFLIGG